MQYHFQPVVPSTVSFVEIGELDVKTLQQMQAAQKSGARFNFRNLGTQPAAGQCPLEWAIAVLEQSPAQSNLPPSNFFAPVDVQPLAKAQQKPTTTDDGYAQALAQDVASYRIDPRKFKRDHSRTQEGRQRIAEVEQEVTVIKARRQVNHDDHIAAVQVQIAKGFQGLGVI